MAIFSHVPMTLSSFSEILQIIELDLGLGMKKVSDR